MAKLADMGMYVAELADVRLVELADVGLGVEEPLGLGINVADPANKEV